METAPQAWPSQFCGLSAPISYSGAKTDSRMHLLRHGQSSLTPQLTNGFERATRKAEGFHSDFRGPFSVPTPEGYLYLLTIIDDYTHRMFGFLAKSQSEWMEIWARFVVRIEAELGQQNCISWILSDNGAVYKSAAMTHFCAARGIQQRFSGAYSQWMNHTRSGTCVRSVR